MLLRIPHYMEERYNQRHTDPNLKFKAGVPKSLSQGSESIGITICHLPIAINTQADSTYGNMKHHLDPSANENCSVKQ